MTTQIAVMTTQEIAERLTHLCNHGKWDEAVDELYGQDAESIEPPNAPGMHSVQGIENIRKKSEMFQSMVEGVHGGYVKGPLVAGNRISLAIGMDVTMKGAGRMNMEEIAVYEVKDGKIVKEQFFF
jgi:SnoaL-like domain